MHKSDFKNADVALEAPVTGEELVRRTEALLPGIAARAEQADRDRHVADETIEEIKAAGLNRVTQPARWGGFELDFDTFFEISWRLASACGSTGWVYSVAAVQNWTIGFASEAVQRDFYFKPDVLSFSALNPRGAIVESVDGGWLLSGRWQFASGCHYADWGMLGATAPEFPYPILLLVPKGQFRVEDTWHVSGLRGTGSDDIVIDDPVFIPEHRYLPSGPLSNTKAAPYRGSYGAPYRSLSPMGLAAPVLGMAQGALDIYESSMRSRKTAFGGRAMAEMAGPQFRIGEASAQIDAARALARSDINALITRGAKGDVFSDEERVRFRRNHAFIVNLCYDATMRLARASGASALSQSHPLQRFMRDVHAGSQQIALDWDEQAEFYGRVRMGLEPTTPFF